MFALKGDTRVRAHTYTYIYIYISHRKVSRGEQQPWHQLCWASNSTFPFCWRFVILVCNPRAPLKNPHLIIWQLTRDIQQQKQNSLLTWSDCSLPDSSSQSQAFAGLSLHVFANRPWSKVCESGSGFCTSCGGGRGRRLRHEEWVLQKGIWLCTGRSQLLPLFDKEWSWGEQFHKCTVLSKHLRGLCQPGMILHER